MATFNWIRSHLMLTSVHHHIHQIKLIPQHTMWSYLSCPIISSTLALFFLSWWWPSRVSMWNNYSGCLNGRKLTASKITLCVPKARTKCIHSGIIMIIMEKLITVINNWRLGTQGQVLASLHQMNEYSRRGREDQMKWCTAEE